MKDRVTISDTTLRDGEQSSGCSMTVDEKLLMAHKLSELNVDVMEVGFPIASSGDFEAVRRVAAPYPRYGSRRLRAAVSRTSSWSRGHWSRLGCRGYTPSLPLATSIFSTSSESRDSRCWRRRWAP